MSGTILILNGPNLNLLGQRQPDLYGHETLNDVARLCSDAAREIDCAVEMKQSNYEGQLVEWIQEARNVHVGIVINPGAYSHTSIAILDALNTYEGPVVEVHVSNIHARESFRHHSYVTLRADGVIIGCGVQGYPLAVQRVGWLLK